MENQPLNDMERDPVANRNLRAMPFSMRRAMQAQDVIQRRRSIMQWYQQRRAEYARRRRESLSQRAAESSNGAFTFSVMGRWAVEQAARAEVDPELRRIRRNQLLRKWQEFTHRAFHRVAL